MPDCRTGLRAALIATLAVFTGGAGAEYPERPIRLIISSAAGGSPDVVSRILAVELVRQMAQQIVDYPDESDLDGGVFPNGSYPVPSNMPIETWPVGTGGLTLQQWQMDVNNTGGDRHGIMVAPSTGSAPTCRSAQIVPRDGSGWHDARRAVAGMAGQHGLERLVGAVHEIGARAAVDVQIDEARRDEAVAGVDHLRSATRQ